MILPTSYSPECIEWFRKREAERRQSHISPIWISLDDHRIIEPAPKGPHSCGICGADTSLDLELYGNAYTSPTLGRICAMCAALPNPPGEEPPCPTRT